MTEATTSTQIDNMIARMIGAGRQKIAEQEDARRRRKKEEEAAERAKIAEARPEPLGVIREIVPAWMHEHLIIDTEWMTRRGGKCAQIDLPGLVPVEIIMDYGGPGQYASSWRVREFGIFTREYEPGSVVTYDGGPWFNDLSVAMVTATEYAQRRVELQAEADEINRQREERASA